MLDVRDGHVILTDSSDKQGRFFQVVGDRELNQVHIRVPSAAEGWTLEFTEQPRSPSPPYGYATNTKRATESAPDQAQQWQIRRLPIGIDVAEDVQQEDE